MTKEWVRRHRLQHEAYLRKGKTALDRQTSSRFAYEFEAALRERGAAAKAAAAEKKVHR
jgi:hypothetical protein